jgi:hypothetical protein
MQKKLLSNYLFDNFKKVNLINSQHEFSLNFLFKCKNYYYNNTVVSKRDLPLNAAIDCLIQVRKKLKKLKEQKSEVGPINDDKIVVLEDAEIKLQEYLRIRFRVAEIVEEIETIYDHEDYYGVII